MRVSFSREIACILWLYHSGFHLSVLVMGVITPYDSKQELR